MATLIGIDPGMRQVAVCCRTEGRAYEVDVLVFDATSVMNRLHELERWIDMLAARLLTSGHLLLPPGFVAVESALGHHRGHARWMPAFWWIIARSLERSAGADSQSYDDVKREPRVLPVEAGDLVMLDPAPAALKRFVTGKGSVGKVHFLNRVSSLWGSGRRDGQDNELPDWVDRLAQEGNVEAVGDELAAFALCKLAECCAAVSQVDAQSTQDRGAVGWHVYQTDAARDVLASNARILKGSAASPAASS